MSNTITVTVSKTNALLSGTTQFGGTNVVVTDASGVALPGVILTGKESPAWTAVFTGAAGTHPVTATITDIDTHGATIGTPIVLSQGTFPQSSSATLSVV